MRKFLFIGLAAAAMSVAPSIAEASALAELTIDPGSTVTLVSGGCGPGGFRARNGLCYRRGPPRYFGRACPPRFHFTRFGCRPNY